MSDKNDQKETKAAGKALIKASKPRVYRKISQETWISITNDWESGLYTEMELVAKYAVPKTNIDKYIRRHSLIKGKNLPVIQANIGEKNRRMFEKHGMGDNEVTKLMVGGMIEPVVIVFEGKGEAMQANTVPDYKTRLDYIRERNKMTGAHVGTAENPVMKEGDKHVHIHLQPPKDATPQQSLASYLSLIRGETW